MDSESSPATAKPVFKVPVIGSIKSKTPKRIVKNTELLESSSKSTESPKAVARSNEATNGSNGKTGESVTAAAIDANITHSTVVADGDSVESDERSNDISNHTNDNSQQEPQKEHDERNIVGTSKSKPKKLAESPTPIPYKEPEWAGVPNSEYKFEILKNGVIIGDVDIMKKSWCLFGRMSDCDVVMEHPSLSRYHAIVQYRGESDGRHSPGFYVYDLDSTHGTYVNKVRVEPRRYIRLYVGYLLKFAGSSRLYMLHGPSDDEEAESELTVTELKQLAEERRRKLERSEGDDDDGDGGGGDADNKRSSGEQRSEDGCMWGMDVDDAVEDADPNMINPFSLPDRSDIQVDDPKKTLRAWFEREGYDDVQYDVEEVGFGHKRQFCCRIELPVDHAAHGDTVVAEVTQSGKKKDAIVACALQACRILDGHGVLRSGRRESHKRKRKKKWSAAAGAGAGGDESDDDDTFLDRTGDVERRKEKRRRHPSGGGSDNVAQVDNYDTLCRKLQDVEDEMLALNVKLKELDDATNTSHGATSSADSSDDVSNDTSSADILDQYMSSLKSDPAAVVGAGGEKGQKKQLRYRLLQLDKDKRRLVKLVNIARPASLPAVNSNTSSAEQSDSTPSPRYGSRKISRNVATAAPAAAGRQLQGVSKMPAESSHDEVEIEEEEEEEEEGEGGACEQTASDMTSGTAVASSTTVASGTAVTSDTAVTSGTAVTSDTAVTSGTALPSDNAITSKPALTADVQPPSTSSDKTQKEPGSTDVEKAEKSQPNAGKQKNNSSSSATTSPSLPVSATLKFQKQKDSTSQNKGSVGIKKQRVADTGKVVGSYKGDDANYDLWMPPTDQRGDGKTSLNDKYGY